MTPDDARSDPLRLAHALLAENSYLTLATADSNGHPWASPVWFAAHELDLIVWASKPGARHSLHLAENPRFSAVVFNSSEAPGDGSALYLSGNAALADTSTFPDALVIYNARSRERGLDEWDAAKLREPARHRLYLAVATEAFVLDDRDERVPVR
jgi:hypothetical protein